MPHFFSNKRLIVLMISIIILVAMIGFTLRERDNLTWPEQFLRDSVGFVQTAFYQPAQYITNVVDNISDLFNLYEENRLLKSRLEEYATLSAELQTLRQENKTLRRMLEAEESLSDYVMRPALVIHRSPDRWNDIIGINKGSQHGIEKNMPVISSEGLIGKINQASQLTSTVQLLSDQDRSNIVSAMVFTDDGPVYGFLEGYDVEKDGLMLRKIEDSAKLEVGQQVVTSGLGDGTFPRGLPIGEIIEVEPDEFGLTLNALIKPAANFHNIDQVNVVERTSTVLESELFDAEEGES